MESNIKIKATIPAMYKFFREDSGVRYYEIKDKRYTNAEIKSMPDAERNSEKFVFSVIYRHMELNKPLSRVRRGTLCAITSATAAPAVLKYMRSSSKYARP